MIFKIQISRNTCRICSLYLFILNSTHLSNHLFSKHDEKKVSRYFTIGIFLILIMWMNKIKITAINLALQAAFDYF
jgi:hypothetical protein